MNLDSEELQETRQYIFNIIELLRQQEINIIYYKILGKNLDLVLEQ